MKAKIKYRDGLEMLLERWK